MRKELTVYLKTTTEDEELKISSTSEPDIVVLTFLNGMKVGVSLKELTKALFEIDYFKLLNSPQIDDCSKIQVTNNGAIAEVLND